MNDSKSKRVISVRTPVVVYEKTQNSEVFHPEKCVSDFKVVIKNSKESASPPSKSETSPNSRKSFSTRNTRSIDPGFHERKKTCGNILMNEQHFIVLKSNKYTQQPRSLFREKKKSYQEILNSISTRIKKLKSNERIKQKSVEYDYEEHMQIFRLKPVFSPVLPYSRKKLCGGKRYS